MTIQRSKLIAAGYRHTLVLKRDGLFACGDNSWGQLGIGNTFNQSVLTPVKGEDTNIKAADVVAIAAGECHTLVLKKDGLFACGNNFYGQLGIGNTNCQSILTPVKNGNTNIKAADVLAIAAGSGYSLVLKKDGLFACGAKFCDQFGIGNINHQSILTPVKNRNTNIKAADVLAIAAGVHTLILTKNGLFACGDNRCGQLGIGNTNHQSILTPVKSGNTNIRATGVIAIAARKWHSLVLKKDGLFACGNNYDGQLGIGNTNHQSILTPVKSANTNIRAVDVIAITAGEEYSFVLKKDGLFACGNNEYGQLGIGNTNSQSALTPVKMNNRDIKVNDVITIAAGCYHTLVLKKDGLFACGDNKCGQLGIGSNAQKLTTLTRIVEPVEFIGLLPNNEQEQNHKRLKELQQSRGYCDVSIKCYQ